MRTSHSRCSPTSRPPTTPTPTCSTSRAIRGTFAGRYVDVGPAGLAVGIVGGGIVGGMTEAARALEAAVAGRPIAAAPASADTQRRPNHPTGMRLPPPDQS